MPGVHRVKCPGEYPNLTHLAPSLRSIWFCSGSLDIQSDHGLAQSDNTRSYHSRTPVAAPSVPAPVLPALRRSYPYFTSKRSHYISDKRWLLVLIRHPPTAYKTDRLHKASDSGCCWLSDRGQYCTNHHSWLFGVHIPLLSAASSLCFRAMI